MTEQSALYKSNYGTFSLPKRPDYKLCCEQVTSYETRWPRLHQCQRKRGFGPEQAYCKQHDPEVVKARQEASNKRYQEKWNERRYELYGKQFFDVLQQIANGHNDARGLAQQTIAKFKEGEAK